ncbi:MAG: glycine cleavage system protein GcvH [Longispora sp.]|nr:glycine cleavage system protein GcvH [Longispora sp. (in: high G+C Gram-positive bacteria)]
MIPEDLRYTLEHEWVRPNGGVARVGITHFAQDALGDIVYVSLPEVGKTLTEGASAGEVESTKSVSEIYAPVSGTVTARNEELDEHPELINTDPYAAGWLFEIELADPKAVDTLLQADAYRKLTEQS